MNENPSARSPSPRSVFFWTLCVAFLVVCLISGALIVLGPRIYQSQAIVEFSVDSTNFTVMSETPRQQLFTELEIIDSPELKRQVIEELKLDAIWGKKYNNGTKLSLKDCLVTMKSRMNIRFRPGSRQIGIRVYSDNPAESANIANSLALNYCIRFTPQRGISAKMLTTARVPDGAAYGSLIFQIPKVIIRSGIISLVVACVAWGIATTRAKILRMPPPVPSAENTARRFQKY
jgi:hypothetical protein